MKITQFEDLDVWRLSLKITRDIYDLSSKKEFNRDFGLRDQIRRAVVSVSSNIVEGFEKNNNNEFIRFLKIAKGFAGEVRNQLYISLSIGYITQTDFDKLNETIINLSNQIGKFITYLDLKRKDKQFITR
ncbi:MAG: four helix bundle protein [Patescibacteria group bacterium]|nr:four helix bundle protein [Patescibacteria group bacterium]